MRVLCHANQQEHANQREAAWLVTLVKLLVSCIKNATLQKFFGALPQTPLGGLHAPQIPTYKAPSFAAGYAPVDGVAMGSPLGPTLANIFVGFFEKKIFFFLIIFKGYPGRTQVLIEGVSIIWCVVHG